MKRFFQICRTEFKRMIPLFLFFFVIFSLADFVRLLKSKETGEAYAGFATIFVSALMMAKVILLSDYLPFIERYSHKPLIYTTCWKTLIYLVCTLFFRILDRAVPKFFEHESIALVYDGIVVELTRLEFWLPQIWLLLLLFIMEAYRELIYAVGVDKVRVLFLGDRR
jgi:hypothetical protein